MRKQFKKALSMVLSAAMVLTLGSGFEVKQAKAENSVNITADFGISNGDIQYWGPGNDANKGIETTPVTVTRDGEYTVTATFTSGAAITEDAFFQFFMVGLKGTGVDALGLQVSDVKLSLDGTNITLPANINLTTENDDEVRIVLANNWNSNFTNDLFNVKTATASENITVTFKVTGTGVEEADPTDAPSSDPSSVPSGSASSVPSGSATTVPSGSATTVPSGSATEAPSSAPSSEPSSEPTEPPVAEEPFKALLDFTDNDWAVQWWGDPAGDGADGVVAYETEVAKEGEGQYKVALDFRQTANGEANGMAFMDLEILGAEPYYANHAIRIDAMKINGEYVDEAILEKAYTCSDNKTDTRVNLYNSWCPEDNAVGREEARTYGAELADTTPWMLQDYIDESIKTIEVAFTYGTADYINAQDKQNLDESIIQEPAAPTDAPSQAPSQAPTQAPSQAPKASTAPSQAPKASTAPTQAPSTGAAKGTTVKVSGASYKVTGASAVEYSGSTKKNPTSVTVPATVKVNGKTYKVTSIKAKAFANKKKLKSVTIGKNITKIGKQAFFKCPKLTKITFKGTAVKSIGAKAFAKGAKKPTVTVPKKMKKKALKTFQKKMKKAGLSKKAKYKKK